MTGIGRWAAVAVVMLVAGGGCAPRPEWPASEAGCRRMCAHDYDVCGESAGAQRGGDPLFGAPAACQRQLRQCQDHCRTPVAPDAAAGDGQPG